MENCAGVTWTPIGLVWIETAGEKVLPIFGVQLRRFLYAVATFADRFDRKKQLASNPLLTLGLQNHAYMALLGFNPLRQKLFLFWRWNLRFPLASIIRLSRLLVDGRPWTTIYEP